MRLDVRFLASSTITYYEAMFFRSNSCRLFGFLFASVNLFNILIQLIFFVEVTFFAKIKTCTSLQHYTNSVSCCNILANIQFVNSFSPHLSIRENFPTTELVYFVPFKLLVSSFRYFVANHFTKIHVRVLCLYICLHNVPRGTPKN